MKKLNSPLTLLIAGYFLTRLPRLDLIPIFTDEAIYLRWAQVMSNNLNYFFLPLTDGKPPLFIWASSILMHFFPSIDPLISGRIISVIAGAFALSGIYLSAKLLFKKNSTATIAGLLYLLSPFTFFYDRFALADGMLTSFGIWSLYFALRLASENTIRHVLCLGIIIGLGLLTKTTAIFFFFFYPLAWLFLKLDFRKINAGEMANVLISLLASGVIAEAIFHSLKIFNQFYIIGLKNSSFLVPLETIVKNPFIVFFGNFHSLLLWQVQYFSLPFSLLIAVAITAALINRSREKLFLISIYTIYLLAMAAMNKVIYARYLLIFTPLLLLVAASLVVDLSLKFKNKWIVFLLTALLILPNLHSDYLLLTNPPSAQIADNDSNQYLNSWSAGYGVKETVQFLQAESKKSSKVVIGMEGTFGLLPFALEMYSHRYPNVEIKPYWPPSDQLPQEIASSAKFFPTYYIIYQRESHSPLMPISLVTKYRQGRGNSHFQIYKVNPQGF